MSGTQLEVTSPCTEDWDLMSGNDQIRFCSHCQNSVRDLTKLNRKQIRRLIAKSKGQLCVRYHRPSPAAVPGRMLYKIGRRTSKIAASAFSATLGISTAIVGSLPTQATARTNPVSSITSTRLPEWQTDMGSIHGVIFDPSGEGVSGASVTLTNIQTKEVSRVDSNYEGAYEFESIPVGTYVLKVTASRFTTVEVPNIVVRANDNNRIDQTLSIAAVGDPNEIVRAVIMGGASFTVTVDPLVRAAQDDNIEAVKELLKESNPNARDPKTSESALEWAVRNGNREMVQVLLWAKVDVNGRDGNGQTALMSLGERSTSDLVWDLINAGAKVNLKDKDGDTALSEAALVNNTEVLKALLEVGAKVNVANNDGETALMKAASEGLVNNIHLLVNAGADINQRSKEGKTALMIAKENDHRAAVRLLVSLGAIEFEQPEKQKKP